MHGAVIAQQETGGTITVHPGRHVDSTFEVVRFVHQTGGDVSRTIIGHVDRTISEVDDLIQLADTGCVIEYDMFGIEGTLYPFSSSGSAPTSAASATADQVSSSLRLPTATASASSARQGFGATLPKTILHSAIRSPAIRTPKATAERAKSKEPRSRAFA